MAPSRPFFHRRPSLVPSPRSKLLTAGLAALLLAGCGHTPVSLTVSEALGLGKSVDAIALNPELRYLRVTGAGRPVLMVLGYVQPSAQGALETWYSSSGEVLQLREGRLVSTTGLQVDWRAVRYTDLPTWAQIGERGSARFKRERDEMPGYRFGLSDTVSLQEVAAPRHARLVGLPASELRWFEETVHGSPHGRPSARYGLRLRGGQAQVVYGEQCLAPDFCMAWQTWPVQP